jgi:2-keto-3-deoxy-L-rhamnonate aldolase RhmA
MTRLGTVLSVADLSLAESAAAAFDAVWLDLEHGSLTPGDAQSLAIAVQGAGCEAHVRLPHWGSDLLPAVLDAGVDGVVAPRVESAAEAAAFARRLRYPPGGNRGYGPRRAGGYGRALEPPRPACTVQIESVEAVAESAAIAQVEGVDAVVVGCADLALALGVPHSLVAPELRDAARRVAAAAARAEIEFGVACGGEPAAVAALLLGRPDLVIYSVDVRLYARAVDAASQALALALEEAHAAA